MINNSLILFGKSFSKLSQTFNLGHGSTWPGHIALNINKNFIKDVFKSYKGKVIFIAGTNGKTTTTKLIQTILEKDGKTVFRNLSGANLLNGIASSLISNTTVLGTLNTDFAIFEIDENTLPLALQEITPDYIVLLNLFRDQLDRYGEVNSIADKWSKALQNIPASTTLILNADDPTVAHLGQHRGGKTYYFGLNDKTLATKKSQHAVDSTYCPSCHKKLTYKETYFSHLGNWECLYCGHKRPQLTQSESPVYPLPGVYNQYNTLAAVLVAKENNVNNTTIENSLKNFKPAFGRQELLEIDNKKVQLFLSKNPTSLNQSLRTVQELGGKHILLVLNDRIPDGRDVSWIWDVDLEEYLHDKQDISVAGDRAYDMAVRLKYAHPQVKHVDTYFPLLEQGVTAALAKVPANETLYILPTYSAMLEIRKILTGKKIL